jgi:hypothetical protein
VHRLRNHLGLRGFYGVYCDNMSGGIAIFCHEGINVDIKDSAQDLKSSSLILIVDQTNL